MRYLKSIYRLLEEVDSYKWELVSDDDKKVKYMFFDTNDNKYLVEFKNIPRLRAGKDDLSTEYELSYFVLDERGEHFTVSRLVNVNPFSTMKTIFDEILLDFIKRKMWVKKITMTGLSKDREKSMISQRTKMYVRHLERNPVKGFRMENFGNKINLIKL